MRSTWQKKAPIAIEAAKRIDALFAIEREINSPIVQEQHVVHTSAVPLITALEAWLREHRREF